jgi:alcohol dehydrogenase
MRSYRFDDLTGLESLRLHEEDLPTPQRGELLLRVLAVALNHRDIAMLHGTYPRPPEKGLIPVSDAAAEVVAVGEGVEDVAVGDRVVSVFHPRWFGGALPAAQAARSYGVGRDGWLTEYKVVSQEAVVALPRGLSAVEAATLPCAAVTAWNALSGPAPVRAGHTVLTLGSGGVSVFALQLARAVGTRVIATTSSPAKAARLRELGADDVVDYASDPGWGSTVRELTGGRGVDRVVEVGGPATIAQSLAAVASGGEITLVGFLGAGGAGIDYFDLLRATASVRSVSVGDRVALQEVVRVVAATGLRPVVDRVFGFDDAPAAFAHLESGRHLGKIVISVHPD